MGIEKLPIICDAAVVAGSKTGCPAKLLAAQCILESGWLADAPGNNASGIKSYPGEFGRQLMASRENFTDAEVKAFLARGDGRTARALGPYDAEGRRLYAVEDWFATFPTLADCFAKHAELFQSETYAPFFAAYKLNGDFPALVRGIAQHYATSPSYAGEVLQIAGQQNVIDAIKDAEQEANLW